MVIDRTNLIDKVHTEFDSNVERCGGFIGSALLQIATTAASRRVAEHIQNLDIRRGRTDIAFLHHITGYITPYRMEVHRITFASYGQVQRTESVRAGSHQIEVIHLHVEYRLALSIQGIGRGLGILFEAVEGLERTAVQPHTVRFIGLVIIVIIVLIDTCLELISAALLEDRITE